MIKTIYSKPITVLMLTITIIIFGLISLFKLPVNLMPSGSDNVLAIITRYHGVSPEQIEKTITIPIEEVIGGIEGIKEIYSVSKDGESQINIYFYPGKNIDHLALKIREEVDKVADSFPRACEKPYIIKNDPEDKPIFIFNIKCNDMSLNDLRLYAENNIKKDLSRIDGISQVDFSGGSIKEIHIDIDPTSLASYGIEITKIGSLMQNAYYVNSQGKILEYNSETGLYTDARFKSLKDIEMLPIFYDKDKSRSVLLKDIAIVYEGAREKENITRLNGEERVSIYIKKSGDSNTLEVCNLINNYIKNNLNNKIKFEVIYDQSEYINRAINNVKNTAILGGIIAIIVLIVFIRNIKAIVLISFSIPFSIVLTFFLMYIFKIEINIMTLSGFALGIGMLLDNGIVMIESISMDLKQNDWKFSERSIAPIISSTLTTVAIFFPIIFLNYEFRRLYGGLALTVTFSLISSILCAIVIIPAGYGIFDKVFKQKEKTYQTRISLILQHQTMRGLKNLWKKSYLLGIICVIFILVIPFIIIKIDKEYIDPASGCEVTAYVEMEAGTSLDETERIVKNVENVLRNEPDILRVNSRIQKWHADIDIKYNAKKFSSQEDFIEYIKIKTNKFKDCFVHYEEKEESEGRIIDIDIIGDDDDEIRKIAKESAGQIANIHGIRNVVLKFKEGEPSLTWIIDRDKCQNLLVPVFSAGEQLRWAIYAPVALKYIKNNKEMDLRIGYSDNYKRTLNDVKNMFVFNSNNDKIYIKELGSFNERIEPGKIYRKNKRKTVRIGVYLGKISLSKAIPEIKNQLKKIKIKDGYYFDFGDILEKLKESQTGAVFALLLSIFIIYSILAIQFESFTLPLKIIPIIPISVCFSIIILFILKMSLNLSVYIGLIILSGVVVNNTILITESIVSFKVVNFFTLYKIIKTRINPVFVTTSTTILALIPMIFQYGEGSELWRPLAITLLTGLSFGTFINLSVYPMLFTGKKVFNLSKFKKYFKSN